MLTLIWFDFDLFIVQVHKFDKIQLQIMREKQQKQKLTTDSEVPGGFPRSEPNHYLKGLRKPSWHNKK